MQPPFAICMNEVKALLKRSDMSQISFDLPLGFVYHKIQPAWSLLAAWEYYGWDESSVLERPTTCVDAKGLNIILFLHPFLEHNNSWWTARLVK